MSNRELLVIDGFLDKATDSDLRDVAVKLLNRLHGRGLLSVYIPLVGDDPAADPPPITDVADGIESIHVNGPGVDILIVGSERFIQAR